MQRQTLASALNAAIKRQREKKKQTQTQTQTTKDHEKSGSLVAALERSATRMDQIVQRRIGLNQEPTEI